MGFWSKAARLLLCVCMLGGAASCASPDEEQADEKITVRLAAPLNSYIQDFDTNRYKRWLEEKTGLTIEMTWLPSEDAERIARQQLQTGQGLPDAYVGFGNLSLFQNPNIQHYGEQGLIIPLNGYIEEHGVNVKGLFAELPEHRIRELMTSADGSVYFMPGFSSSTITRYQRFMWVNRGWLDALGMEAPTTTGEFRDMLLAFRDGDPNGNGVSDEIPMAGTEDAYGKQPYDYLMNAFIYNDSGNSYLVPENGVLRFAPVNGAWRDGLAYLRGLFDEGLYSPLSFTQDDQQFKQLANDPRDILGAFLSPGITFTVLQNSPEIMARYVGIGPLAGPGGVRRSTVFTALPKPNGVITSACKNPEEVFKLFDLMLSEEACLMGRYGERGVDWDFAGAGEVSIYGTPATVRVIRQLWNTTQNKHLMQIAPYVSRPKFSGGVTWDGNTTDGEYMNAQAALLYAGHDPKEYVPTLIFTPEEEAAVHEIRAGIEARVREAAAGFVTGERDINNDAEWEGYLREFEDLGLAAFLERAQAAYDRVKG
ncbi:MAG: extracellular solute-binding protein [Clostridiales bacterium]|jgi:putative aldouronate transport system substrate-binding protein|nr:extracellular solute-binding protein [Clostridiales bacterium]